ncbi:MAG TPA: DUF2252 family protein [Pirellulales bacterium]|jgi:uncharacterized protein (DUF2252 family)
MADKPDNTDKAKTKRPPAAGSSLPVARSIVEELLAFNRDRKPKGLAIKYARMAADAFAFFRGTLHLFAHQWSDFRPDGAGPEILSCGDLHIENFGAFQTDDGVFCYDINDFDEALLAPAAFDLVRVSASVLLAADVWGHDAEHARQTVAMLLESYCQAIGAAQSDSHDDQLTLQHGSGPIWELLAKTAVNTVADLLDHHTKIDRNNVRQIVRSDDKHPELSENRAKKITKAVEAYGVAHDAAAAFRVLDVSGRVAGVGSLGVRRALVLVEGEGSPDGNKLLDIKQAWPSAAAPWVGRPMPDEPNEAQRVVDAQRCVQVRPTAGLDVIEIGTAWYRMRAMVPDENRSKLDRLKDDPERCRAAIVAAGQIVGRAHCRGAAYAKTGAELSQFASADRLTGVLPAAERALANYQEYCRAYKNGEFKIAEA